MNHILALNSDTMGRGSDELGGRLIVKFVHQVANLPVKLDGVLFYNSGVKLLAPDSVVLDALAGLERAGVELLACGTCVEHFGLVGKITVGRVTDMREIASALTSATRVVTI
jgi:selenium metabolism protein YedF